MPTATTLTRSASLLILSLAMGTAVLAAAAPAKSAAQAANPAAPAAKADASAAPLTPVEQVRAALTKRFPTLRIEGLRAAPAAGLWEFSVGLDVFYVSSDGRYLVRGDVIDLSGDRNLAEDRRAELRRGELAKVSTGDLIVFAPDKPLYTVTVFTDIDCAYCRKMHSQIDEYLKRGIRVRYIAYPRSGLGSPSWQKAQDVWCAKDRNTALTRAKRDEVIAHVQCDGAAVVRGYQLGELFRLDGTPMVISDDGTEIGGYLTPDEMQQRLAALAARRAKG